MDSSTPSVQPAQATTVVPQSSTLPSQQPPIQPSDPLRPSSETPESSSSRAAPLTRLNNAERYWTWKAGLRVVICLLDIVAIGCLGWLMSGARNFDKLDYYNYIYVSGWTAGAIATFCISFAWCLLAILLPFVLRPSRPLHPGIAVGVDLVFWLGFLVLGLFTLAAVFDIVSFGTDGYIQDPQLYSSSGYGGDYYLAPNNTWIYNVTNVNSYGGSGYYNYSSGEYVYPDVNTSSVVRDCTPWFATCQEQDQYINDLWHEKPRREATTILVNAAEWLNLLLHFTLFVWACVDTNRRNRGKTSRKEQIIADRIIADLESKGLISVSNGIVQPYRIGQPEMVQGPPGPSGTR